MFFFACGCTLERSDGGVLGSVRLAECLEDSVGRTMFAGVPDMGGIKRGDWLQASGRILVTLMVFTLVHWESFKFEQFIFDVPAMGEPSKLARAASVLYSTVVGTQHCPSWCPLVTRRKLPHSPWYYFCRWVCACNPISIIQATWNVQHARLFCRCFLA